MCPELRDSTARKASLRCAHSPVDTGFNRRANVVFALPGISAELRGRALAGCARGGWSLLPDPPRVQLFLLHRPEMGIPMVPVLHLLHGRKGLPRS